MQEEAFEMKRSSDDDDDDLNTSEFSSSGINSSKTPAKKRKHMHEDSLDDMEVRFLIPSAAAGVVIGLGGVNIKRLRSEFSANVMIPDSNAPERVVVVTANVENVCQVAKDLMSLVDEATKNRSAESHLKIFIHHSRIGGIMGPNGSKIKEIRQVNNISLRVFSEKAPFSTDRVAHFSGETENVINALKEVLIVCCGMPINGDHRPYDTMNYDPAKVHNYGGFPPDPRWRANSSKTKMKTQAQDTIAQSLLASNFTPPNLFGPTKLFTTEFTAPPCQQESVKPLPLFANPISMPQASIFSPSKEKFCPLNLFGAENRNREIPSIFDVKLGCSTNSDPSPPVLSLMEFLGEEETKTIRFAVPKDLAGAIIGKNGSNIFRIREDSGAHVSVETMEDGSSERIVTVTGPQKSLAKAQQLLQQCIRSSAAGRKFIQEQHAFSKRQKQEEPF